MPYMDDFELGEPELVCRWRLSQRALPLENRHMRALGKRTVADGPLKPELLAWAKQHIEWTLQDGAANHPDGVLMLVVDAKGRAAMTVGPYEPLEATKLSHLIGRARVAAKEQALTGVAPEQLWAVVDGRLTCSIPEDAHLSGANTLVEDLARTLGVPLLHDGDLLDGISQGGVKPKEAFLVSDEHGVVVASDCAGPEGVRSANGYARLLEAKR